MMTTNDILKSMRKPDGTWSADDVDKLAELTGKSREDLISDFEKEVKPAYPEGKPITWQRDTKLKFINENGRDEYERLIRERK